MLTVLNHNIFHHVSLYTSLRPIQIVQKTKKKEKKMMKKKKNEKKMKKKKKKKKKQNFNQKKHKPASTSVPFLVGISLLLESPRSM